MLLIIILLILIILITTSGSNQMEIQRIYKENKKGICDANFLLSMSEGMVYNKKINPNKLNKDMVYVGYIDNVPVATTTIKMVGWGYDEPKLSTSASVVNRDYRRMGLMTELKCYVFDLLKEKCDKIHVQVDKNNEANKRAVEKLGFVKTHEFEDHIFYEKDL